MVPILKEGKDENLAKSHRPVCLLSILGKTFERLIISKSDEVINKDGYASDRQFGFKPKSLKVEGLRKWQSGEECHRDPS